MKRKYSEVGAAQVRQSVTGTHTYWVCFLKCGHTQEALKWKRGWRTREKPAPVRMVCRACEKAKETV